MQTKIAFRYFLLLAAVSCFVSFGYGVGWPSNTRAIHIFQHTNPYQGNDGWNYPGGNRVAWNCRGYHYTGFNGQGESMWVVYENLPPHSSIYMSFNLALLDSWDSELFLVYVNGGEVKRIQTAWQWHNGDGDRICGTGYWPDWFTDVYIEAPHTGNSVSILMTSNLDQPYWDEGWGISNLYIEFRGCNQGQFIWNGNCVDSCPWGTFISGSTCNNCDGNTCIIGTQTIWGCGYPAYDDRWQYVGGWRVEGCYKWWVGRYGAGAYLYADKLWFRDQHNGVKVAFWWGNFDSWDSEWFVVRINGGDQFVERPILDRGSRSNICWSGWNDQIDYVTFGFNHTAQFMSMQFASGLDQDLNDESWGVCDVQITAYSQNVDKHGNPIDGGAANYANYLLYFGCGNAARDAGWVYYMGYTRQACGGRWYLGGFGGGEYIYKQFHELPAHQSIHMKFQLASIDSWDNEWFYLDLDDRRVFQRQYHVYNDGRGNICGQSYWNDLLDFVDIEVNHSPTYMKFVMGSTLDQYWTDEAWGVCDLQIWFNACPVGQYLQQGSCVGSCAWGFIEKIDDRTCVSCAGAGLNCISSGSVIYPSNNIQALPGWSYNQGFRTSSCSGLGFLGRYGRGGEAEGPIKLVQPHQYIRLSFTLAPFDSWDFEHFYIAADGNIVFDKYFWVLADGKTNLCYSGWGEILESFTIGFAHNKPDLTLKFWSSLDQDPDDEAWGISDITFILTDCQLDKYGRCLNDRITDQVLTAFPCATAPRENNWDYVPYYTKIQCGGSIYQGRFANGASLSTNYFNLPSHQAVTFQFNLAFLDLWEGQTFYFKVDGNVVYQQSWTTNGANVCGAGYGDTAVPVVFTVGHSSSNLAIQMTSNVGRDYTVQGWGICDFKILINACPNNQFLYGSTCVANCPWGFYALDTDRICKQCADGTPCVSKSFNYFASSEPKQIEGWKYSPNFNTYRCAGDGNRAYLRYGAGQSVQGKLTMGAPHTGVILGFRMMSIDSWDWESFNVKADGNLVFTESYWLGEDGRSQLCGGGYWLDDVENYITAFNHTSQSLDLLFDSTLNQDLEDESWGLADLTVTLVDCGNGVGVDSFGRCLNTANNARIYNVFGCSNMAKDLYWNYSPSYYTYGCNSETFVGRYGAGGSVSTFFRNVPAHQSVALTFKVLATDQWNSQQFIVKADGINVYSQAFSWSDNTRKPLCGNSGGYANDLVDTIKLSFNHNLNQLGLSFTSTLDQAASAQGWGICDVQVSFNVCPKDKFNTDGVCVDVCPWGKYPDSVSRNCVACTAALCANIDLTNAALTLMPCNNPAQLSQFSYVTKYTTVAAADKTFVGLYTQGDYVTGPVYFQNPHSGVLVSFELYVAGPWNDVFTVQADGVTVFAEAVTASKTIILGFNHTVPVSTLKIFAGSITTAKTWGICGLTITPMDVPVDKYGQGLPTVDKNGGVQLTKSMYNTIQQIACLCSSGSGLPATFLNEGYLALVQSNSGSKFGICDIAKASYCFITCGDCKCNGKQVNAPSAQALEAVVLKTSMAKQISCPGGCKDTFAAGKTYTGESFAADCANFNVNNIKYKVTKTSDTTLTQTMIVEKRNDADDNQPKPTKPPRSSATIDFGPSPPVATCSSQVFKTTAITDNLINLLGDAKASASNNITLTSGKKNQRSAIWYKNPVDIAKGFRVEFMLNLLNPTCTKITFTETRNYNIRDCVITTDTFDNTRSKTVCTDTPKTEIITYQKDSDNCGSEGVAFVIQPNNPNQIGAGAAGLGYEGILNALAIEFDASYNYVKNDPDSTKARHISIILKKGAADANEDGAIAWNDKPLDFKAWDMSKKIEASQVVNPLVRIEYMGYQIRVFINNILQLSYSHKLDLAKELGLSSPQFYIGFTGSTGELVQTSSIFAWNLGEVQAYADTSVAEIYYPSGATQEQINNFMGAGTNFDVYVTVKDKCGNSYAYNDLSQITLEDVNGIKVLANNTCKILTKEVNTNKAIAAHFRLSISCTVAKLNYVNIQFAGRAIRDQPLMWRTIAGPVSRGNILFDVDNKKSIGIGNTDKSFMFMLNVSDAFGNVVPATPLQVISALKITWPTDSDSKQTHTAVFSTDTNLFYIFVDADKTGTYTISSPWFANSRTYQFVINGGLASPRTSSVELVDSGYKPLTVFKGLQAGQNVIRVLLRIRDSKWNELPIKTQDDIAVQLYWTFDEIGRSIITSPVPIQHQLLPSHPGFKIDLKRQQAFFELTPTSIGVNSFVTYLFGGVAACSACTLNFVPGPMVFENTRVWVWHPTANVYYDDLQPSSTLFTNTPLSFLVVLRDQYNNVIDENPNNFKVTISGYNLPVIDLTACNATYRFGKKYTACTESLAYKWTHTVGKLGYDVTIAYPNDLTKNPLKLKIDVISSWDDLDAGNGPMTQELTTWWPTVNVPYLWAGQDNYYFIVNLKNSEGKRFNEWHDNSKITLRVFDADGTELTKDSRVKIWTNVYWRWGYHIIGTSISKSGKMTYQLTVDGKSYSSVKNYTQVIKPWIADNGFIQTDVLEGGAGRIFKEGCVEYSQNFVLFVYDQYKNPSDYAANRINLEIKGDNGLSWSPAITKDSSVDGKYYVNWNTPYAMRYSVTSYYFRNTASATSYSIYMRPGFPSRATSYAQLLFDPTQGTTLKATDIIRFALKPRDRFGNDIPVQYFVGQTDNYTVSYIDPKTQTQVAMTNNTKGADFVGKLNGADASLVIWTVNLTRAGTTAFRPLLKGQSIVCSVCSVLVDPNVGFFPNVQVSMIQDGNTKILSPTDFILLNNYENYPILTLQMADIVYNLRTIDAGWSNFKATLENTGNSSRYNYSLTPAIWANGMKFAFQSLDPQVDNYKKSAFNKEWFLKFSADRAGQTYERLFKTVTMYGQGPSLDQDYDNADISPAFSTVSPAFSTLEAGKSSRVTLQIRTKNNKIRKDIYANVASSIKVSLTPAHTAIRTSVVSTGAYGLYVITVYGEKAQNYTINVNVADDSGNSAPISQKPIIKIFPTTLDYSVLESDQNDAGGNPVPLTVDSNYTFALTPYDRFNNVIYNIPLRLAGVNVIPKLPSQIIRYQIGNTLLESGLYRYSINQQTSGTVLLLATNLKNKDLIPLRYLEVVFKPGKFDPNQSIGKLIPDEINAGETFLLRLNPRDQYGNSIVIEDKTQESSTEAANKLKLIHTYPNGTNVDIKMKTSEIYTWKFDPQIAIIRAGSHKFTLTYDGKAVSLAKNVLKVWPLPADFGSSLLFQYDTAKNIETPYNGSRFAFDASQLPTVSLILNDQYENIIVEFPKTWAIQAYIRDSAEQLEKLNLCPAGNKFSVCPSEKATWYTLAPSVEYSIFVTWGDSGKKRWDFKLFGFNSSNNDLSNYPLSVQNSILSPTSPQTLTAGQSINFFVELRAVDGGRKAIKFVNPNQNITFSIPGLVAGEHFKVNSTEGDKDGRYNTILTILKTSPALSTYNAQLVLANTYYDTAVPKIVVVPASYNNTVALFANQSAYPTGVKTLESSTTDSLYNIYLRSVDYYGNIVPLTAADIGFSLNDPNDNITVATKTLISAGLIKVSFQPTLAGQYVLQTKGVNYTFTITPGTPDSAYTNSTVDQTTQLVAGTNFTFTVTTFDRYGNPTDVSADLVTLFKVYFKKDSDIFYQYAEYLNGSINGNTLKFAANVTEQGHYQVFATLSGLDLACRTCGLMVVPAPIYPLNSRISFFDIKGQQFVFWKRDSMIKEDNSRSTPLYTLEVADVYGNVYSNFPADYVKNVSLQLTPPSNNKDALPAPGSVDYTTTLIDGDLFINVSQASNLTYFGGSQVNGTYTLTATIGGVAIPYSVFLNGAGASDLDASYGAFDVSQTYVSRKSIVTSVTTHELIMIELRTVDGKRKKDVYTPNITLGFAYNDKLTNYTVSEGDKPGRYLISLLTNRSFPAFANQSISYLINGSLANTTSSWVVAPGQTKSIVNMTDLSVPGSADRDYEIILIPRDEFNNTAVAQPEDVSATFLTPDKSAIQYTAKTDEMGRIVYNVQAKVSGEYSFISWMFTDGQNNKFFKISSGMVNAGRSNATFEVTSTVAGNFVKLYIFPKDSNGNLVPPTDKGVNVAFTVAYSLDNSREEVNYPIYAVEANNPDFVGAVYANITFTTSGKYKFFIQSKEDLVPCANECNLQVNFSKPELPNTKFLVFNGNNQFQESKVAFMQAGSNNINVDVKIYDQYQNPVKSYSDQQRFLAVWSGHNMTEFVLNTTINNGDLILSVPTEYSNNCSWLVPASDYQIQIFYQEFVVLDNKFLNISNFTLQMNVKGDSSDAGNGPMIPQHAKIDVTSNRVSNRSAFIKMTAGEETSFVLTLRTINDERYNEDFDPKSITVKALNETNWKFTWFTGGSKNVYTIHAATNTSADLETLTVFVDGVLVGQPINVIVNPNVPDIKKTVLHRPTIVENHQFFYVTFELYDTYGNQFYRPETLNNFTAHVNSGNVKIVNEHPTKLENNSLTIQIVPSYPPITFSVQVSYSSDGLQTVPVFGEALNFTVRPVLDPYRLEVESEIFTTGIESIENITYAIFLHDTEGYCYEPLVNFTTTISGPYFSNDPNNNDLVGGSLTVNSVNSPVAVPLEAKDATSCQMVYLASFPAGTAKTAGYYRIQVLIKDKDNTTLTVYDQKVLKVKAGPMSAPDSEIFVAGRESLGSQPWTLQVGIPFTFHLQAFDDNKNMIGELRPEDKVDASFDNNFYNRTVNYFSNGTWAFTFVFNKTGEYLSNILNFTINGESINANSVDSSNFPTSFILTAGDCSAISPVVNPNFVNSTVLVGDRTSYIITCKDRFGNRVVKGGAQFRASVQGNKLETVGSDILTTTILDNQDGTYIVSFETSWSGAYVATFFITETSDSVDTAYGVPLNFNAIWDKCDLTTPYKCPNEDKCISTYSQCTDLIPVACTDPLRPISCTKKGIANQCVEAESVCDAPEGYTSCENNGDNKFVPTDKVEDFCPAFFYSQYATCPDGFGDAVCQDTTCRYSFSDCPSPALCPIGYTRCLDTTCVPKGTSCPSNFPTCDLQSIRCPTMECKPSTDECPSRVTCAPGEYVCLTDNSCVKSASQCRPPSKSGAPAQVTCSGSTPTLCSSGICVKTFSKCPTTTSSRRILDTSNVVQIQDGGCPAPTKRCPGGECVLSEILCPKVLNCPPHTVRCSDNTCAANAILCYSAACKSDNPVQCWNGMCVSDTSNCPTRSSCPNTKPVKCHDGTCADSLASCPEYISCPHNLPVRCDTGDCRQYKSDCPTIPTCPESLPILCQDGSCRKSVQYCEAPSNVVVPQGKVRCPDGSFASSSSLCTTGVTCARGLLKCWDGACVSKLSQCAHAKDHFAGAIRCPDGSVRSRIEDCPTRRACPVTSPVYCDDGNCRQSSSQCVANTCPTGLRLCPDGTCALQSCGTPITCSTDAPFKCYDNTCRSDPKDCPQATACPKSTAILCPDGTCVQDRMFCKASHACDSATPVRCPNMACATSVNACTALNVCPQGSVTCDDGSCAPDSTKCKPTTCPPHLSFKCPDGFCVADQLSCDNAVNACPANKPTKCADGLCVSSTAECKTTTIDCPANATPCPDGSCAPAGQCPVANGCPVTTPLRCASGECIDSKTKNCTITRCPAEAPVKCLNGFCAKSNLFCIASFSNEDAKTCANQQNGNIVPCADGRCVSSSDLCRPVLPCPTGMNVRCDDGSCRAVKSQCPKSNSCPAGRSYRCSNGVCAKNSTYCPQPNGCPTFASTKCSLTGDCAASQTVCDTIYNSTVLPNGCTAKSPFICPTGECVANKASCPKINDCPENEILCPDKVCRPFWKADPLFPESADNNCLGAKKFCPPNYFVCPDHSCQALWSDCKAKNKCAINTPFKCSDGSCKAEPTGPNGCSPTITCSERTPFLCADGACVGDPSLCRVVPPCPAETPLRCPDRSCTDKQSSCQSQTICPITTPILCKAGGCVSSVIDCPHSEDNDQFCSEATPFVCASGICVSHPLKCFMGTAVKETTAATSRRLLEALAMATSSNHDCPTGKTRCADGTCRANSVECPISNGCSDLAKPYKCSSGRCVSTSSDCNNDFVQTCATGTKRCEDGLCRASCFAYNGCPLSRPLQCPDGYCGVDAGECAGESACDNDKPFRCADGACAATFLQCRRAIRTFKPADIQVSVSPFSSQTIDFIHSNESFISYATVTIPSGAFASKIASSSAAQYVGFNIRPVADSLLANVSTTLLVGSEIKARKFFPLSQSHLASYQTARSAAVNFTVDSSANSTYRFALLLTMTFDATNASVDVSDYCLGVVSNSTWKCASRNYTSFEAESNTISFLVAQNGIYAVIYNPLPAPQAVFEEECSSWACKNKLATLAISIGSAIIFCIIAYYVHRVYRYQVKYMEAKVTLSNYKQRIDELKTTKTNVYGQTLRDKVEGISFVANPLYEKYMQETIANQENRYTELETALEKKRVQDKEFETTNKKLSSENRILSQELQKLKNQAASENLKKNDKVKIKGAAKVSEFM